MKIKIIDILPKLSIVVVFIISLFYILNSSSEVRFWADDFCSSTLLRNNGYVQSQIIWWQSWTGRYSYIAFLDLVELFGVSGAQTLPVVMYTFFTISIISIAGVSLPVALLLSVVFLFNSTNIIQSFYWMTGSLNYFAPFIFLNLFLILLFKKSNKYFPYIGFLLLFIATGFSEAFGVANVLFLILLLFVFHKRGKNKIIYSGLLATLASLVIMYFSPGNEIRSAGVSHPDSIFDLLSKTFYYSKWYLSHLLYIKPFLISVLTILVGAFVFLDRKYIYFINPKRILVVASGFIISVTLLVVGLTYQAMNWEPPERVMTIVNYMILYAVIIIAISIFQIFKKYISKHIASLLFTVLVILLSFEVSFHWKGVYVELKNYSSNWDVVENHLKSFSEGSSVTVDYITPVGKLDGFKDNKGWVSACIAGYYKLDKLEYKE